MEEKRVEQIANKSIKITLISTGIVISIATILGWIMLNNTTALAGLNKDAKERDAIIKQLQEKVRVLEKRGE